MGGAASVQRGSSGSRISNSIDYAIEKERITMQRTIKLLLLGPGESGKTTVLKQMRILHNKGFTEEEMIWQTTVIRNNIVTALTTLLAAMKTLDIPFGDVEREADAAIFQKSIDHDWLYLSDLVLNIQRIWHDSGMQFCYNRRDEYYLLESAKYFLDNVERILLPAYRPTEQDILYSRVQTTSVTEVQFCLKNILFRVVDVGGQRSQRMKWLSCFSDVSSIIFIVALSEYNQVLLEDSSTNRMLESLHLFDYVSNNPLFRWTNLILFLNKKDVFEEKIGHIPLRVLFPNYEGSSNAAEASAYIKRQFLKLNRNIKRQVYCHETCATDTNQIRFVLDTTLDTIVAENLTTAGMS